MDKLKYTCHVSLIEQFCSQLRSWMSASVCGRAVNNLFPLFRFWVRTSQAFLFTVHCSRAFSFRYDSALFPITKYGSTLYIGMDEVLAHYACTFENSNLHFHFQ